MKTTTVNDYIEQLHALFPELTEKDIKRIMEHGLKSMLHCVTNGNSFLILTPDLFFFIGWLCVDSLKNFVTYCKKLANRIKYMFYRRKELWDGYYYFALTENEYQDYLSQSRKKYKTFKNIMVYKILDYARVDQAHRLYIFRTTDVYSYVSRKFYKELKTDKAELIIQRDAMNMKDIMVSYNKFKYIS